jgi:hypothetical protein
MKMTPANPAVGNWRNNDPGMLDRPDRMDPMLIENPLNMLAEIQRHSLDSPLYIVRLYHPDHGNIQRTFDVYDELEQTLSGLLIAKEDLQRAKTMFMNGRLVVTLGQHTFPAADLSRLGFRRKIL